MDNTNPSQGYIYNNNNNSTHNSRGGGRGSGRGRGSDRGRSRGIARGEQIEQPSSSSPNTEPSIQPSNRESAQFQQYATGGQYGYSTAPFSRTRLGDGLSFSSTFPGPEETGTMDVASSHVPVETLITGLGNTAEEGGDSTWSQSAAEEPNARLQQGHDNTRDIATDRSDEKGILSQKNSERQVTEEEEDDLIDLSDLVEVLQLADIDTRISGSKEKSSDEKDVLSSEIEGLRVDDRELRELQMIGAETVKLGKRREDYTPNPTAPEFVPTNSGPMDHTTSLSAPSTTAHTSSGSENRATGPGSSRNSHSTPVRQLQTPQQQFTFPSDLPANQIETLFKAVNYLFRQVKTAKDRFNRDKGRLRMAGRSNLQLDLFLGQLGKGLSSQQDKTHLDNSRDMLVALRNQVDDVEISLDQMFLAMKTTEEEIERLLGDNGLDMRIVGDRLT